MNGVRVLEGVGGVRVEEPAAVGPELLDRLLRGDRAHRDRLRAAGGLDVRVEVLDHALGGENEGGDEREGEEKPENDAGQVDPEVADPVRLAAGEPADQGDHDRDAGRGREEVLDREPGHLREVARGDLARVRLPVGVGHERDGGVQGEVGGEARHACRVEREDALEEEQDEEERDADGVEEEEVAGVPAPRLLGRRVDAEQAVDRGLEPPDDRRGPVAEEEPGEVPPEEGGGGGQQEDEGDDAGCVEQRVGIGHRRSPVRREAGDC